MKPQHILQRLLQRIEEGAKTPASALLYAQEYDRIHDTNLTQRLQRALRGTGVPARASRGTDSPVRALDTTDSDESPQTPDTPD